MKKSTLIVIFIVYLASIVAVGLFGMSVKVYDQVKYVSSITVSAESSEESALKLEQVSYSATDGYLYRLRVDFSKADTTTNASGEEQKVLEFSLIPKVAYESGEISSNLEAIVYLLDGNGQSYVDSEYISTDGRGQFLCHRNKISFQVTIRPKSGSSSGAKATIRVIVA